MPYKYLTHDDVNDLGLNAAQRAPRPYPVAHPRAAARPASDFAPDPDGKPWDYAARLESALNEQETAGWRVVSIQWNDQGEVHSALLHQEVVHGGEPPAEIF